MSKREELYGIKLENLGGTTLCRASMDHGKNFDFILGIIERLTGMI